MRNNSALLAFIVTIAWSSCSTEKSTSVRGRHLDGPGAIDGTPTEDKAQSSGATNPNTGDAIAVRDPDPVLTVDDIFLYFADDRKGALDSELASISSDDLRAGIAEKLGDHGLTERLLPLYLEVADLDGSSDLNFSEFLVAGVERDGQEEAVQALVEKNKQAVFSFIDFDRDGVLGKEDILRLVSLRVWQLRHWAKNVGPADPVRIQLLAKTGYSDLHKLVASTYNDGDLTDTNFTALAAKMRERLKQGR